MVVVHFLLEIFVGGLVRFPPGISSAERMLLRLNGKEKCSLINEGTKHMIPLAQYFLFLKKERKKESAGFYGSVLSPCLSRLKILIMVQITAQLRLPKLVSLDVCCYCGVYCFTEATDNQ